MISNLLDIKKILQEIPDEVLKETYFGMGEGADEDIGLVTSIADEDGNFTEVWEKYPKLDEIGNLVKNITKGQNILDEQEDKAIDISEKLYSNGEPMTSTFFVEADKKASSNHNKIKEKPQLPKEELKEKIEK